MNKRRIMLVAVSAISGVAAFGIIMRMTPPSATVTQGPAASPSGPALAEVLVAARDIPAGVSLKAEDVKWTSVVAGMHPEAAILRNATTDADLETKVVGSVIRQPLASGEILNSKRLVRTDGSGYMAFTLSKGMRAVAVDIDMRGVRSAGNFILPDDRVDVLVASTSSARATTLLRNIRVLAIGQHLGPSPEGNPQVAADTVTLEVDPAQAEMITGAAAGTVKLSLRPHNEVAGESTSYPHILTVRYGVTRQP